MTDFNLHITLTRTHDGRTVFDSTEPTTAIIAHDLLLDIAPDRAAAFAREYDLPGARQKRYPRKQAHP